MASDVNWVPMRFNATERALITDALHSTANMLNARPYDKGSEAVREHVIAAEEAFINRLEDIFGDVDQPQRLAAVFEGARQR